MAKNESSVSMRVRIGDSELEVSGPRAFVESKIEDFLTKQKEFAPTSSQLGRTEKTVRNRQAGSPHKKMSAAQFFKKASAKSDVERALIAGYYLEKNKGFESFTSINVRETIRSAKIRPPTNPSDTIAKNIKKGFMMSAGDKDGKMAFVLTSDGEESVEETIDQG